MHRADVAVTAVTVGRARRERPARLEPGAENVSVGGSTAFAVWTSIAALDRRVADTTVSADLMTTAVRVNVAPLVLYTQNTQYTHGSTVWNVNETYDHIAGYYISRES